MSNILEFLKTDTFLLILLGVSILSIILVICSYIRLNKLNKNYSEFMKKVGNGNNIEETLIKYMNRVEKVEVLNKEILSFCENLDKNVDTCFQKIGIVRYNAFKDVGSDLSFAVAILDNKNSGIIFNGIYSRDTSNIYAKPIKEGKSEYTLSNEEQEALSKAISNDF